MTDGVAGTAAENLAKAEALRARTALAGRWYSWYLVVLGLVSAAEITLVETVFAEGFARYLVIGAWSACLVLGSWWAARRTALPIKAGSCLIAAIAVWFGAYLLLVGPLVRWQFGTELLPWAMAALGLSVPFFIAAAVSRMLR
ncbi:hypothetical protein SAMN02982929_00470 [Saccharopolyspora kobensis]|uniref:Uncharacterized protein n=1 Tax=Saccharopolyspora kobensis TaxID=146035 RepID=A0A1H5UB20_9PSEU|nr:hypothetical protein [Saccharopolyspora kobensis]SEF72230.1 hypothetical protein SAMN02982929_00470 [Saccharopolyspora kobensis]SFC75348.1 hypothetical protein SAMN05216506_1011600 [Saccharopolyspora kobensis]